MDEAGSEAELTVAGILRQHAAEFVARFPGQAAPQVQSTLAKLSLCRTAALGAREYRCGACDESTLLYNSCGDRHCPQCSGAKRSDWMESTQALLLDGVHHFQVVATLPSELSALALGNRRAIYDLLFRASWQALEEVIREEQRFEPAGLGVLHTWNQKLEAHAHVHWVIPGGGPALQPEAGWLQTRRDGRDNPYYLVDANVLRCRFRERFLKGMERLYQGGELKLEGEYAHLQEASQWERLVASLSELNWVVYIEPPPTAECDAAQVVKYLARYLTGGPISDRRLIRIDATHVEFWAREGTVAGGERRQIPVRLPIAEFVRRWCLHVLPKGYTKTRRYGGWSPRGREAYVERCAVLLEPHAEADDLDGSFLGDSPEADRDAQEQAPACPSCGQPMELSSAAEQPSWSAVMNSPARPHWYRRTRSVKSSGSRRAKLIESA